MSYRKKEIQEKQNQREENRKTAEKKASQKSMVLKQKSEKKTSETKTAETKTAEKRTAGKKKNKTKTGVHSNREIMLVTYFFVFLFLGMMGYLAYFTATSKQDMINNSYNSRQEILLSQNYRGNIYAAGGEILARTLTKEDGTEVRFYPYENLFSHVVGYSTKGKTGVEAQANYYLINSNLPLSDKAVNSMAGRKNAGDSVYTTLDVKLQSIAEEFLSGYEGAVIVTEPSTGKILAMVSKPDFDPNEIADIWEELIADTESSVLLNRATQGLYPPGSTFKIITALEYIRENPETYKDYSYKCKGVYKNGENTISCYHGMKHGAVDFYLAFAKSCNSAFADIGMSLDKESFAHTLKELLFNQELPLKLSYSKSTVKMEEELDDWEMMQTVIGQGKTQMSPIHLNMITCAVANGGILMQPYVVDRVETGAGNNVKTFRSSAFGRLMAEEEAFQLTDMMKEVIEEGTGKRLAGLDYTVAGKTGSAEYSNVKGESHAWFTGFAPAENPQICVTVIIEGAGSGGDYAIPIAKRIFDAYFDGK